MRRGTLFLLCWLVATVSAAQPRPTVAVAASLMPPLQEIADAFAEAGRGRVDLVSASSGVLTAQIQHGAPFALFVSADLRYPEALHAAGLTAGPPRVVTHGQLVCWNRYRAVTLAELEALLRSDQVGTIALPEPTLAPYGRAARQWLEGQGLYAAVADKFVYGDNVGQTNRYLQAEAVDVAFTATSARVALPGGYWLPLPTETTPHALVLLRSANATTRAFADYLFEPAAQAILRRYGYRLPGPADLE